MSKPKVYKERNPFHPSMPWRACLDGLSWPARTWDEAIEKVAVHLVTRRRGIHTNGSPS